MFSLLLSLAAGIHPIITSSSDTKIEKLQTLGNVQGINYKTHPNIAAEVFHITQGRGVDYVVNNIGLPSIASDIEVLRKSGSIALVGFLGGFDTSDSITVLMALMMKAAKIQ